MSHHVVVGGSKGVGREFIKNLLDDDSNRVTIVSRGSIDIKSDKIEHVSVDLNDIDNLSLQLRSISEIDSIVFFQKYRPSSKCEYDFNQEMNINVIATKQIIEILENKFKPSGLRSIVLIGSVASNFIASEQPIDYHISKSSLIGILKYYAVKLGESGIRVNMVSPSTIIKDENKAFYDSNVELYELYKKISPLKDVVKAKDVSNLVYYLLSKKANFITGQDITIDGGISLQWHESLMREHSSQSNQKVTQ
jgi:NAD(P)-dependent dehydrogenase (short-subunit alcohol dehydrogenase family)